MLAPEIGKILRHLNGPHAGRKDVHAQRNTALSDAWRLRHTEKFLNAQRNERRAGLLVADSSECDRCSVSRVPVHAYEQIPLRSRKPRLHGGLHLPVLEILVSQRSMTELFDDVSPVFRADRRKTELRAPLGQSIEPQNPLLDGMIPLGKPQSAGHEPPPRATARQRLRRRFHSADCHSKIAKAQHVVCADSHGDGIQQNARLRMHIHREKFVKPVRFRSTLPARSTVFTSPGFPPIS